MRILGWMHRKLRQNSTPDPFKDFNIGRDPLVESKPAVTKAASSQKDHYAIYLKTFPRLDEAKENEEETMSDVFTHWHHDFLAIGTLGMDPVEPLPVLEKEPKKAPQDAIGNPKNVVEEEKTKDEGPEGHQVDEKPTDPTVDPWSTYPLGPVHDPQVDRLGCLVETDKVPPKKEHRISLGELFSKIKMIDDSKLTENKAAKSEGPKAAHLVKKILKRRSGCSKNSGSTDNVPVENKIHKLFHMFNRKVHPSELCTTTKKCTKGDTKHNMDADMLDERDNFIHVDPVTGKEKILPHKSQQILPAFTICGSDSNSNGEYWIKTDADYLVLEL